MLLPVHSGHGVLLIVRPVPPLHSRSHSWQADATFASGTGQCLLQQAADSPIKLSLSACRRCRAIAARQVRSLSNTQHWGIVNNPIATCKHTAYLHVQSLKKTCSLGDEPQASSSLFQCGSWEMSRLAGSSQPLHLVLSMGHLCWMPCVARIQDVHLAAITIHALPKPQAADPRV